MAVVTTIAVTVIAAAAGTRDTTPFMTHPSLKRDPAAGDHER